VFDTLGMTRRRLDEVAISPLAPEEYGLILDNAGTGLRISKRNMYLVREMCTRLRTEPGRPLVLKNPWDCANFIRMKTLIPEARFVFIHRHPERTLHSHLNATRDLLESRNDFGALIWKRYAQLYSGTLYKNLVLDLCRRIMIRQRRLSVRLLTPITSYALAYFAKNIGRLDKSDYLSIRYEDLCERPSELLRKILDFAGIDPSYEVRPLTPSMPRKVALLPEVEWYRDAIARKNAAYMKMHGYGPGGAVLH
jgi:hypothetical protein